MPRSIEPFRNCVSQRPDWLEALVNLGQAQWRSGDLEAAKASLTQAVACHPQSTDALRALAALASRWAITSRLWTPKRSCRSWASPFRSWPSTSESCCEKSNLYEDAARTYRRAAEEKPGFAEALLNLGHALKALGQEEEARTCWQQAVEAKPELAEKYF